jgi:hypothetical protein
VILNYCRGFRGRYTWKEIEYRWDMLRVMKGAHVEVI